MGEERVLPKKENWRKKKHLTIYNTQKGRREREKTVGPLRFELRGRSRWGLIVRGFLKAVGRRAGPALEKRRPWAGKPYGGALQGSKTLLPAYPGLRKDNNPASVR